MATANVSLATKGNSTTSITPAKEPADLGGKASGTALALDTTAAELQTPQAHPSNSPLSVVATNSPLHELEPFPQYPPSGVSGWLMRTFARRSASKEMKDFKRRNTPSVTKGLDAVAAGSSSASASTLRRVRFNDPTATAFFAPPTPEVPPTASVSSFNFSDEPRALIQRTPGNELSAKGHAEKEPSGKKPAGKEDTVKGHGWWPFVQHNDGRDNAVNENAGEDAGTKEQIQGDPAAAEKAVAGGVVSNDKKSAKNAPLPADPSDLGALMLFTMTMPFMGVATYVGTVEAMGHAIRVTAEGRGGGLLFPPRARPAVMRAGGASDLRPKEKRRKRKTV